MFGSVFVKEKLLLRMQYYFAIFSSILVASIQPGITEGTASGLWSDYYKKYYKSFCVN